MDEQRIAEKVAKRVMGADPFSVRQQTVDKLRELAGYVDNEIDILEGKSMDDRMYYRRLTAALAKLLSEVEKFEPRLKKQVSAVNKISWG